MKINSLIKKLTVVAIIATLGVSLVACGGNANKSSESKAAKSALDKDELVIGLDDTFVPMGFKNENGEIVGFDVDLANAVGKKLNKKVKFQSIDWSMKETELNNGNIDLIWNGYSITDERKEKVEFSKPYLSNTQVIVTLADSNIESKNDLAGKKVGAQNGSTAVDAVEAANGIEKTFDGGKLVTFEDNNAALMDLEAKRLDAIVVDEILARYYMKARGEEKYKILTDNFGSEKYGVGIKKGDTKFVEAFNKALDEVISDGTAADISKKWFEQDIILK
ncbi:amino acid ABC transporter substrate-binding protein [Clostridium beijerinckii]|jgi:polar amino acid transport system substrate-binding protein|uniref:Amino acid ABC transporter substrate-binding protein n=2 Tax=Clostridium beijerinckii TaxID=1520 RepID=A0AAE2V2K9_CLOBE|nr:amino acid ABC transporter substrate-binding protein [Clostridium beijerinckii]ABR33233.1 extracellular solute-binding protein, family 3 [Clostridium beijerinckii NCIMB 8052]AIU02230.1 extracellular solute-binding protein [Clostridium beijerinckii ATCC 35702]MBF7811868.1 amino acid ABC transporter substrate-binding protein [Clostridium beijerinckii]NRT25519.1 polar amino acid transport system substrate-binding protein [Clostridium beijerinckii]NRT66886.1 polar amino acid transport system su